MRILSRHFLANYLGLFAVTLTLALILMAVIEMVINLDDVVDYRDAAGGALAYLLIRVPALYLRDVIPAASAIAAFLCLALAARAREITALKTGGIPPFRVALPILMAAVALSGCALLLNETLLLSATREFTRLHYPNASVAFTTDSFWYHRGDAFYNVREIDPESGTMEDVQIYRLDPEGRLIESLHGANAVIDSGSNWRIHDATRRRFDPGDPGAAPRVDRLREAEIEVVSPAELDLLQRGTNMLSIPELLAAIDLRQQEDRDPLRYRAVLSQRLAEPAAVFVLALLVLPIAIGVERGRSLAASAVIAILLVAGYRATWQVGSLVSEGGFSVGAAIPWVVVLVFTGLGATLFARAPR